MEVEPCSVSGCNNVEFAKGKCITCTLIAEGEALKTHERPIERPMALLHNTKKMFESNRLKY